MSSSGSFSALNPGSKAYLYSYLQNSGWYKAQLLSVSGSFVPPQPQQGQSQGQAQNQGQTQNPQTADTGQANRTAARPRITGQIINTEPQQSRFTIRTDSGATLTLKLPKTAPVPPEGLRIQLELPKTKETQPPKEGQNISFRPLPKDSQPAPIRQQLQNTAPPSQNTPPPADSDVPLPAFKPAAPLVDTPPQVTPQSANTAAQEGQTTDKPTPLQPPKLESGSVITIRPLSEAEVQTILPLPAPTSQADKAALSTQPQATPPQSLPQSQQKTATQMPEKNTSVSLPQTAPQPQPAQKPEIQPAANLRLNVPTPQQLPVIDTDILSFFTAAKDVAAILQNSLTPAPQPKQAQTPDITLRPAPAPSAEAPPQTVTAKPSQTAQQQPQAIRIESVTIAPESQPVKPETAPPPQTTPAPKGNETAPPPVRRGEIIGQTAQARPVVVIPPPQDAETPQAVRYVALDIPADNITQGTQISFTETTRPENAMQSPVPQTTQNIQAPIPETVAIAAHAQNITFSPNATWPALEDITQTLQMAAPQQAQALMNQSPNVQNPAIKMEPAILFFLAAARSGDVANWLGSQSTEILRQAGKSGTLNRIMSDFMTLSRPSQESGAPAQATAEWRSMPLPLFAYNEAHKIMLHYKYDENAGQEDNENGKAMRFVIDLDMSKMGNVQLDGFAQKGRLDLIVRTLKPLSPDMQQIMRRKYSGSLEATGFAGELGFHGNPDKFIKIEPASSTDQSGISV